eukprot:211730-Hanusia_phi.AAC.1
MEEGEMSRRGGQGQGQGQGQPVVYRWTLTSFAHSNSTRLVSSTRSAQLHSPFKDTRSAALVEHKVAEDEGHTPAEEIKRTSNSGKAGDEEGPRGTSRGSCRRRREEAGRRRRERTAAGAEAGAAEVGLLHDLLLIAAEKIRHVAQTLSVWDHVL